MKRIAVASVAVLIAIASLKADGTLDTLTNKWFYEYNAKQPVDASSRPSEPQTFHAGFIVAAPRDLRWGDKAAQLFKLRLGE
jgi:hypothetical protein